VGTVIAPRKTLAQIAQEHSSQPGFFAALLYAYLYLITELVLVVRELPLSSPPLLPIPAQDYYIWQFFFTLPVTFVAWRILGEVAYGLVTKVFGRHGRLRQYLNTLSFAFHVPFTLTLWVAETATALFWPELWGNPDAPGAALGGWVWNILLAIGLVWSVLLGGWGIKTVSGISWPKSLVTAFTAVAATIGFYLIFIR
jgi:hypothetical protein